MLSHRNYVANIAQLVPYRLMENSATTVQVRPMFHAILYCTVLYYNLQIMPMFHAAGMKVWLDCLVHGTKVVTLPSFTPDTYLDALLKHQPDQVTLLEDAPIINHS